MAKKESEKHEKSNKSCWQNEEEDEEEAEDEVQ